MKTKCALLTIALGCWLISVALMFCNRCLSLCASDIASGFLFIFFGLFSLSPTRVWSGWAVGLVGVWLQLSPVLFWANSPLLYFNDTLIGVIAIAFSFLLTRNGPESNAGFSTAGSDCPRGWSYNPSAWLHRIPVVGLAMLCWFFARYMAAYQLGFISQMWDPFFPNGTLDVITSDVSRSFPVSDAGMGAICYTIEALLGWQGGTRRWMAMPWLVFSFAFLVIPVGIVSITLIILQPVLVGAWCSWCLATAFFMLCMIVLTAGEFAAVLQFLKEAKARGESTWQVFWRGGVEKRSAGVKPRCERNMAWGFTMPFNFVLSALLGLWLMFAPYFLELHGPLSTSDFIQGPILFSISVIAMAEVFRFLRWLLIPFGAWLILAPFVLSTITGVLFFSHCIVGVIVILCAFRRGRICEVYGAWESLL